MLHHGQTGKFTRLQESTARNVSFWIQKLETLVSFGLNQQLSK